MHSVSVTRAIDAPIQDVWQVLDDFGGVAKYNPNVEASRIVTGPDTGAGATRECVLSDGGRIEQEIVDYESGTGYTINFTDTEKFPPKKNVVEISVESLTDAKRGFSTWTWFGIRNCGAMAEYVERFRQC